VYKSNNETARERERERRKEKLTNFGQHKYSGGSGTVVSLGGNLRKS